MENSGGLFFYSPQIGRWGKRKSTENVLDEALYVPVLPSVKTKGMEVLRLISFVIKNHLEIYHVSCIVCIHSPLSETSLVTSFYLLNLRGCESGHGCA